MLKKAVALRFLPLNQSGSLLVPLCGATSDPEVVRKWLRGGKISLAVRLGDGVALLDAGPGERDFLAGRGVSAEAVSGCGARIRAVVRSDAEESVFGWQGRDINIITTGYAPWPTSFCKTAELPELAGL